MNGCPDNNDVILGTGGYFDIFLPSRPDNARVTIETIARGLANICRYGGQPTRYYSVAEHSVLISHMVPPEHARAALLHDAAEALIGDIRRPLKKEWPQYLEIEAAIERVLADEFAIDYPWHPEIKDADNRIIWLEQRSLFDNTDDWSVEAPTSEQIQRLGDASHGWIKCMGPEWAFHHFMARAKALGFE